MTFFHFDIVLLLNCLGNRPHGGRLEPFCSILRPHSVLSLATATVDHLALFAGLLVTKPRQFRFT